MFENLKTLINQENLNKIKRNQRYLSAENSDNNSISSNQENSFEDQINDRIQVFNLLNNSPNTNQEKLSVHKNHQREQIKKLEKEISMLEQKIRIEQSVHERQIEFLSQQHQMQINTFKIKLDKCQHQIKKYNKNQSIVNSLKKDVKRFMELHEQDQKVLQKTIHELTLAKKQIVQMKILIKKKQESEAQQQAIKYIQSSNEIKLNEQLASIEKQRLIDNERKKQLQKLVQKLRNEKEELEREIQTLKLGFNHQVSLIEDKFKSQITKLEQDNQQLKRRNHMIQESFIDHLTQTSLNLQQNIRNIPQRSAKKNSSLYLQESPIRARSKDRKRDDHSQSDDDPEKKDHQSDKLKVQIKKLRSKLEQANEKIVELLRQKCVNKTKVELK